MSQHQDAANHTNSTPEPSIADALMELTDVGRTWADQGLRIGAAALQTSALTLTTTAGALVKLASGLSPDRR